MCDVDEHHTGEKWRDDLEKHSKRKSGLNRTQMLKVSRTDFNKTEYSKMEQL